MAETLDDLLRLKDQARARVCGAAQNALWFFEAEDYSNTYKVLKTALDELNAVERLIMALYQNSSSPEKPSLSQKENTDGNRTAA